MKNRVFVIGIVFAATLAYVVGNRLSNEAIAVVVGALCGISASIPISIALFIAASRNWGRVDETSSRHETPEPPRTYAPPMMIFAPPQPPAAYPPQQLYFPSPMNDAPRPREFKIIGDE